VASRLPVTSRHPMSNKVVIFSAPSGAGKSTVVNHCLGKFPQLAFSISATTRPPRGQEKNGVEYYFVDEDQFRAHIQKDELVEWQQVYKGRYYGTLKAEVERLWSEGKVIVFDVDVQGGYNLKKYFGDKALSVFIKAPSVEVLRARLNSRGTDTPEAIDERVTKASEEIAFATGKFDYTLINDDLSKAFSDIDTRISDFLG